MLSKDEAQRIAAVLAQNLDEATLQQVLASLLGGERPAPIKEYLRASEVQMPARGFPEHALGLASVRRPAAVDKAERRRRGLAQERHYRVDRGTRGGRRMTAEQLTTARRSMPAQASRAVMSPLRKTEAPAGGPALVFERGTSWDEVNGRYKGSPRQDPAA